MSMKLYNFSRLIIKYSTEFTLVAPSEGEYDGGIYVYGEPEAQVLTGAIIPMPQRKVYQPGGNYTSEDKELYMLTRIAKPLLGGKVLYQGDTYSIEEETDYSDFSDIYHYVLRKEVEQ